jgi:hypothetical protein
MSSVFRVVQTKDSVEMHRFTHLAKACAFWVKYPAERHVEELTLGTNDVIRVIASDECCRVLRNWLSENKLLRDDERRDLNQLVNEADVLGHLRGLSKPDKC